MTLARSVVVPGMISEYGEFAALLDSLSDGQWETASRCEGWRVARQVDERRGSSAHDLAAELRTATKTAGELAEGFDDAAYAAEGPQGNGQTLGFGLESLWFDTYLHADDIRTAVGQATTSRRGLAPSVSHITQVLSQQAWTPAIIRLTDMDEFQVSGGDPDMLVSGDPMQFILVSTGRADPGTMGLDPAVNIYR